MSCDPEVHIFSVFCKIVSWNVVHKLKGTLKSKCKFLAFSMEYASLKVLNKLVSYKTMTQFTFRRFKTYSLSLPFKWITEFYHSRIESILPPLL